MADNDTSEKPKGPHFWDSLPGLVLLVAAILLARYYILEPYKIPSGSMEPTLIGHEDFGDRIVTNKLAFAPKSQVYTVIAGSIAVILLCFAASKAWKRTKAIVFWVLMFLAVPGGLFVALMQDAVASDPKRFGVTVFNFDNEWNGGSSQKINYIKRMWGLPGEELRISGGDIFKRQGTGYEILRKPDELQEAMWFPVANAWSKHVNSEWSEADQRKFLFPWSGADEPTPGAKLLKDRLELDGSAPVKLEYKHPITNVYVKQGRWPFTHQGCPKVKAQENPPDAQGIVWRNPKALKEDFDAYISGTSNGVQCVHCKELLFPIVPVPASSEPQIIERSRGTNFLYGGNHISGDQRIDLELNVETPGTITLEAGSTLNRAVWSLGGSVTAAEGVHAVKGTPALSVGRHTLSLRYVDATVSAWLDGKEIEHRELSLQPPMAKYKNVASLAQLSFAGFKGSVTALNLYRDFFYTPPLSARSSREDTRRGIEQDGSGDYWVKLDSNSYLMLGDNSAGSSDGRNWGSVPREELIGRAGVVWWPPSRWRVIK